MSKYIVSIPIAGAIHIEVEASSSTDAKVRAWDEFGEHGEKAGEIEWEAMDCIAEGNVCHAPLNEIEVNKVRERKELK